jgi:hypothetical protein
MSMRRPATPLPNALRFAATFMLAALSMSTANAKCMEAVVQISGQVVDANGAPVPGAIVGVSWTSRKQARGPALAQADARGEFIVRFPYDGPSRFSFGFVSDVCMRPPKQVSVSASAPGLRAEGRIVPLDSWRGTASLRLLPVVD